MRSGSRPLEGEVGFRTFDVTRARKYGRSIPRSKVLRFLKLVKNVKKLSNTHADMINHRSIYAEVGNSKFIENLTGIMKFVSKSYQTVARRH